MNLRNAKDNNQVQDLNKPLPTSKTTAKTIPKADPTQEIQRNYTVISADWEKATQQNNAHVSRRENNIKRHNKP
jgi:hypothetical protein